MKSNAHFCPQKKGIGEGMKLKYVWYRIRQFGFSAFLYLAPLRQVKVIRGEDSLYQIPDLVKKEKKKKILLVTTAGFIRRGSLERLFALFTECGLEYVIFSEVCPDPTTDCIEKAVRIYQQEKCEAIVAIGGGSVLDCSKALGAKIARPERTLCGMQGLLKVRKKIPDIYAVPTTAGTGSEATAGAVITEAKAHYKFTILDLCLVPKYAILDPMLTCSLPKEITAYTGMDALTHAVEAYTNRFCSPAARKEALTAVKLIYENLRTVYEDGQNREARENMLYASYLAGAAINHNFIGYIHAVAHGIGGMYGVPHGKANAIVMPYVLEAYGKKAEKKLAVLAKTAGLQGIEEETQEMQAAAFITSLREWNTKLEIGEKLDGFCRDDMQELAKRAVKEGNPMYPVPVIWEKNDFLNVMEKIG